MPSRRLLRLLPCLMLTAALAACGGGSGSSASSGSGTSTETVQGVSMPSSVSVVTAKNAK
jgi:hypothetical protein